MSGGTVISVPCEDYKAPPCKRQRKDDEPPNKSIKKYFSPVSRGVEKLVSSPRSSNIADYFIKSSPTTSTSPRSQPTKNGHLPTTPLRASGRLTTRRTRLIRRLGDTEPEDGSLSPPAAAEFSGNTGFMGSDTAALLAEICSKAENLDEDGPEPSKPRATKPRPRERKRVTPNEPPIDLTRPEGGPEDLQPSVPCHSVLSESTVSGHSSLEVHVGHTSSLLTVSYEDFLKSQAEEEDDSGSASHGASLDDPDLPNTSSDPEPGQQPSPKTVTIQAQVHLFPPLPGSPTRAPARIASIFCKKRLGKGDGKADRVLPKRKSNVVIEEEDLELAVIDVETMEPMKPKSTAAERQRFMKAFRQAGEAPRTAAKKSVGKRKDGAEGGEGHSDQERGGEAPGKDGKEGRPAEERPEGPARAPRTAAKKSIGKRKDVEGAEGHSDQERGEEAPGKDGKEGRPAEERLEGPARAPRTAAKKSVGKRKEGAEGHSDQERGEEAPDGKEDSPAEERLEGPAKAQRTAAKKSVGKRKDVEGAEGHSNQERGEEAPDGKEDSPAEERPEGPAKAPRTKRPPKKTKTVDSEAERRAKPQTPSHQDTEPPQQSPVLRRSLRRQRSDTPSTSPLRTAAEGPLLMSTPKVEPPSQDGDLYKAEVLTVPSETESPIRMRFTRINRRLIGRQSVTISDDEAFTPGRKKVSSNAKKINKAKQLLEKARAIQQNIAKAEAPQRRSARQQKRLSQERITIDDTRKTPISQPNEKKTTNLRSLHDVLGKKAKAKGSASGQKKEVKKKAPKCAIITIDDGSEVSENSQDGEQFKAKREFLMSGLPDSLKRHIAKAAALSEAYTLSSLSFHSVVHVQQKDGCEKWNLVMPHCSLLTKLVPASVNVSDVTSFTLSRGDFTTRSVTLTLRQLPDMMTRRPAFSEAIRNCLLEEIRCSNPQFPVRRFFTQFLKKQNDYLALQDSNKPGGQQADKGLVVEEAENGAKRKRNDSPGLKSKRRKGTPSKDELDGESAGKAKKGRLARGSLRRSVSSTDPDVIVIEEVVTTEPDAEGPVLEDTLWTEKYQPQSSSELIGNSVAIRRLHSWLRDWKTRAEKEEKRSQMQKIGKDKNDTWDMDDFNDEDSDEDSLCNTMLITGPPGVGKTAAVYASAQELGFKVFEVNASCQRSGRQILAQLKEATQSHQVDQQGVNAHKPCFFSNCSLGKSPRKVHSPKAVVSSPRKPPMSPRGGKKGLAPKSLANFFKAAPKQKAAPDQGKATLVMSNGKACGNKAVKPLPSFSEKSTEETQRKSATSLILFEEVDVIFDDDSGFLNAIKTFMSTTKRPVILTTSDAMFGMMFDGVFEEITFHTPSVVNVASYLQVLCLAENLRMDTKDMMTFLTANTCDIRQSVLQLQFWARSGGGQLREKELPPPVGGAAEDAGKSCNKAASEIDPKELPGCNFGCTENSMGLSNVILPTEGLIPFVKGKISKPEELGRILRLLSEFQSRNEDFISTNLEYLLPLPLCVKESQVSAPCAEAVDQAPPNEDDDEVKMSAQMKRRKKLVLLNDSDLFDSSSCSLEDNALDKTMVDDPAEEISSNGNDKSGNAVCHSAPLRRKLTATELKSSCLVYTCLDSLATLADNLSYVDCCTYEAADQAGACNLNWTESRLRHGLCDSLRIETGDAMIAQSAGEMRAYIEGLALHKCSSDLTKALDTSLEQCKQAGHDPTGELTLHVSKSREEVYFGHPFTIASTAQSRLSTARTILSNRAFIALGNRQVNVTEYLPTLRSICRIEKAKEEGKTKRRFLHYLEGIHLELPKMTLCSLAADFP